MNMQRRIVLHTRGDLCLYSALYFRSACAPGVLAFYGSPSEIYVASSKSFIYFPRASCTETFLWNVHKGSHACDVVVWSPVNIVSRVKGRK